MASGSSDSGSMSLMNDIVSNSSLTASAPEFIPSSSHSMSPRHNTSRMFPSNSIALSTRNSSPSTRARNRSHNRPTSNSSHHPSNNGTRSFRYQDRNSSSAEVGSSKGSNDGSEFNASVSKDSGPSRLSSKPSHRPSNEVERSRSQQKFASGSRMEFRKRRNDEFSQDSTPANEGAVGATVPLNPNHFNNEGNQDRTFYGKDYRSGTGRNEDRNGNRNLGGDHYYQQDRSKFRVNFNDDSGERNYDRFTKRDKGRSHLREYDQERERNRFWNRKSEVQQDDDSFRESGFSPRFYKSHSELSQDQRLPRQSRQHADHNQERPRDDRHLSRGSSNSYNRDYDRGYIQRGSRPYIDINRNERSQNHQSFYQRERGFNSSSTSRETSGAECSKFSPDNVGTVNSGGTVKNFQKSGYKQFTSKDGDDVSQRERLIEQLSRGTLECLVCCDRVRQGDSVWSCTNCFHVLHLRCVVKWAKSSKSDSGWRCPACQNITEKIPSQYRCFCGKLLDPQWNRQDTPHSCGEVCGKTRELLRPLCTHHCTLLCHPGPCPPCIAQVMRNCGCGKTSQIVKCGLGKPLLCDSVCAKTLNCGVHVCSKVCHPEKCEPCSFKIQQGCFCGKQNREVNCTEENQGVLEFCCNEICGRTLKCGNHSCDEICHPGECKPCNLTPDVVTHCPCGQTPLSSDPEHVRLSCKDSIPTCDKICQRKLHCGQPSNPHTCQVKCHVENCPPCPLTTMVRCRCGHMDREIPCEQLTTKADDARCEKKCTKKRSCGKHKCNQQCCIEVDHPCPLPCNYTLSCGLHRCEQLCHRGHCSPCWRTSFEELYCECGTEVLYPPVPCGTKPPPCSRPCSRRHDCDHAALHPCHSKPNCPPCTVLTEKYCHGKHELRKSIPCHLKEFSCGLPCNKELPCGRHKCILTCHKGECLQPGSVCTQPCTIPRTACQHPCSAPCHEGACPEFPCKETVRVTCECGHRSAMRPCAENTREYQRIATSLLASKMADVQLGHSIDIGDIMGNPSTRKLYMKSLECNDECKIIERNRRMAIGLQIRNPDLSSKLTPRYSDFMRGWAKKDPLFCQMVHDKLTELVKLAKESKQKSRSYSFEVMNREKRQFVHEYCEHFGCESVAYDQEPKRNVVATAQKTKAWLPSLSLLELVQRESGQRKVPGPMLNSSRKLTLRTSDSASNKWACKPSASGLVTAPSVSVPQTTSDTYTRAVDPDPPYIDYFNS